MHRPSRIAIAAGIAALCAAPALASDREGLHWGYQGEAGPAHWGTLGDDFATCGVGRRQSPVTLPADAPPTSLALGFAYAPTALNIVNNGHTVQVNHDAGSTLTVDGKPYTILQFHFHTPSENTVLGVAVAMEMHIVHAADDGALAVVGVLFDIGEADNPFLATFWDGLPTAGVETRIDGVVNVADAFDPSDGITSFAGSLTTPPCSEGVTWLMVKQHETVSKVQLAEFVELIGFNARPTQPLNDRDFGM